MKKTIYFFLLVFMCSSVLAQSNTVDFKKEISLEQALQAASAENKKIFIDFYTTWCAPCKIMDKEVFADSTVAAALNKQFINLKINAESDYGIPLAKKFKVNAYPTFVILDAQQKELLKFEGASSPTIFLETIDKGLDVNRTPEALAARFQKGERTPSLVNDYAFSIMQSGEELLGYDIINQYFKELSKKEKANSENLFLYERYSKNLADPKMQYLLKNKKDFVKSVGTAKADEILYRFLRNELMPYANGYNVKTGNYHAKNFENLIVQIKEATLSKAFDLMPLVAISKAKLDQNASDYLDTCKKLFPTLTKSDRFLLMLVFPQFTSEPLLAKKAAQIMDTYSGEINELSKKVFNIVRADLEKKSQN